MEYHKQFYTNKLDSFYELEKFLKIQMTKINLKSRTI